MSAATIGAPAVAPQSSVDTAQLRRTELRLLIYALLVSVIAQCAVTLAHDDRLDVAIFTEGITLAALVGSAHLAVRRLAPLADPLVLPLVTALNGLGLAVIRRLDYAAADHAHLTHHRVPPGDAPLQLVWTAVGVAVFIGMLALVRDHTRLQRGIYSAATAGLVLLLLPSVLPARFSEVNGARIWIRLSGFSIQPSEIAKLLLIVFFAGYLVAKRDVLAVANRVVLGVPLPRGRDLGPLLLAWGASLAVLVREKDLGSSLLYFGAFVAMLYVATERTSWLVIGLGLFVGGAFLAYQWFGHVRERFDIWLHPFADPSGHGYQLVQGLFGFATGGVLGTGLGRGRPDTVPFARTDFVIAAIGEELGLVGVMAVLLVYALFVFRCLKTALDVRDSFGQLLATGLGVSVALQVFTVVGGVTALIPLTGLTLPFLSYGGSSLVASWGLVGLLLRISDSGRRGPVAGAQSSWRARRLRIPPAVQS